jgi:pimeloyl-ACP methyl ester carboxylesterase
MPTHFKPYCGVFSRKFALLVIMVLTMVAVQPGVRVGRAASAAPTPPATLDSAYTAAPCPVKIEEPFAEGKNVFCGYVTVPVRHANPTGKTLQLAVIKYASRSTTPAADPLVMVTGGPGGSAVDLFPRVLAYEALGTARILDQRDIVIIEQRGTLYSKPNLYCDEFDKALLASFDKALSVVEENERLDQALNDCHARLVKAGIDLSAFNSIENAADLPMVVNALGYRSFNLYGISYGTMLSLHAIKEQPAMLRSVILDSVVPLQTSFIAETPQSFWHSLGTVMAKCKADTACNAAYPNLAGDLQSAIDGLNAKPATLTLQIDGKPTTYRLTGDRLVNLLFEASYQSSLLGRLPAYITQAAQGNLDWVVKYGPILLVDHTSSVGMQFSVICSEDADFTPADVDLSGIPPYLAASMRESALSTLAICTGWNVDNLGSAADEPVRSAIPTLLLAGELDPVTPPAFAKTAAETLSRSWYVEFPGVGHGAIASGSCASAIMAAFLDDPLAKPDNACASAMGVQFVMPVAATGSGAPATLPVKLASIGAVSVAPARWTEVQPGAFTDGSGVLAFQNPAGSDLAQAISGVFGGKNVPVNRQVKANDITWIVYQIRGTQGAAEVAAANINGKVYLIIIQTDKPDPAALDKLAQDVLQPRSAGKEGG